MQPFLRTLGWIGCVIYATIPLFWLLIHSRVGYWRSRSRSPYRVLVPLWISMWVALGLLTWQWRKICLYSTPWAWLPALALFGGGFWLYSRATEDFSGQQLSGVPEILHGQRTELVTTGIRARVRHPVYLGHLCELFAWSAGTGLAVAYGLTLFAILTGALMIHMEERELEGRFGEEYRAYQQQVPALFPTGRKSRN